jgi:hypothetical protein
MRASAAGSLEGDSQRSHGAMPSTSCSVLMFMACIVTMAGGAFLQSAHE